MKKYCRYITPVVLLALLYVKCVECTEQARNENEDRNRMLRGTATGSEGVTANDGRDMGSTIEYTAIPTGQTALRMRFNKFAYLANSEDSDDGGGDESSRDRFDQLTPLGPQSYPISGIVSTVLKRNTNAISVVDANDFAVTHDTEQLIRDVGGPPPHPSYGSGDYWNLLKVVISTRMIDPNESAAIALKEQMPLPDRWEGLTVAEVAESVHDEYPGFHQANFIQDLVAGKYGEVMIDHDVIPERCRNDFLGSIVMLAVMNTWSIGCVGPDNFAAKWHVGRARPEEVVFAIKTKAVSQGVPENIQQLVDSLDIDSPEAFTAYPEGAPRHPSWPAMHSAASVSSFWLRIVLKMTPRQICQARIVDHAVAYARTVAGVHYPDDNLAGLKMGQILIEDGLPKYLNQIHGSSQEFVVEKMEREKQAFSWDGFDPMNPCPELDG